MDNTPLSELQQRRRGYRIICRVLRIWDCTNPNMNHQLMNVDFMLGIAMHGSTRKEDDSRIRDIFIEGRRTYTLASFTVAAAKNSFRVCPHDSMIRIGTWTIIKEYLDTTPAIPTNLFHFITDEELQSRL